MKQAPDDYSCGLCCVASIARDLGTLPVSREPVRELLRLVPRHVRSDVESRVADSSGLSEKHLRVLARASGLSFYRPNRQVVAQFSEPGWRWIALVKLPFIEPEGQEPVREYKHYVVVLGRNSRDGSLTVADPHPWRPDVSVLQANEFERAWSSARPNGTPWSACLYLGA
jgi:hypothetical protein